MEHEATEPPVKKAKCNSSLDPFDILHSDVFELIFQHLGNYDVLESSAVSQLWFETTESSPKCMEKLHLRLVVPYGKGTALDTFQNISEQLRSQRSYQNIYLHNFQDIMPDILKILNGMNWKKVYISVRNLKKKREFHEIMRLIEQSVETLSLSLTSLEVPDEKVPKVIFSFPKLQNLDLSRSNGLLMEEISENCRNLKTLKIDQDGSTWHHHQSYLRKILTNNEQLDKLTLWRCSSLYAFQLESVCSYRFKLKTFLYKNSEDGSPSDEEENCLRDFLETQADSLEKLRLEEWFGVEVFRMIFKMPILKELTIDMYDVENTIDWETLNLFPSSSIAKFHIDSYRNNRSKVKIFNALFNAMPNLKLLTMDYLDNDTLKSIGLRCHNLEELEIQELKATRVHDPLYFPKIKRFHCEDRIQMKIKQRINIKPVTQRSKFEQLILTSKPYFVTK